MALESVYEQVMLLSITLISDYPLDQRDSVKKKYHTCDSFGRQSGA